MKVIKLFGFGLLYALLLPFLLLAAAVFLVYGFLKSIIYFFVLIIRFFKGEKLMAPYPEDVEAARRIRAKVSETPAEQAQSAPQTSNVYVQQNYYSNPGAMPGMQPGQAIPPQQNPYGYGNLPPYPQMNQQQMGIPQNPYGPEGFIPNQSADPFAKAIDVNANEDPTVTLIEQQGGENDVK